MRLSRANKYLIFFSFVFISIIVYDGITNDEKYTRDAKGKWMTVPQGETELFDEIKNWVSEGPKITTTKSHIFNFECGSLIINREYLVNGAEVVSLHFRTKETPTINKKSLVKRENYKVQELGFSCGDLTMSYHQDFKTVVFMFKENTNNKQEK